MLSGRCRIQIGEKLYDLEAGDAVSRPAGTGVPHQFSNPFKEPCSVLMMVIDAEGNHRIEKIKRHQTPKLLGGI